MPGFPLLGVSLSFPCDWWSPTCTSFKTQLSCYFRESLPCTSLRVPNTFCLSAPLPALTMGRLVSNFPFPLPCPTQFLKGKLLVRLFWLSSDSLALLNGVSPQAVELNRAWETLRWVRAAGWHHSFISVPGKGAPWTNCVRLSSQFENVQGSNPVTSLTQEP